LQWPKSADINSNVMLAIFAQYLEYAELSIFEDMRSTMP
jgi:hypothetical protein